MSDEIKIIKAPWPQELVDKLNQYQRNPFTHPYTCGECRDKYHTRFYVDGDKLVRDKDFTAPTDKIVYKDRELVATKHGWICHTCDNIQDWCIDPNLL